MIEVIAATLEDAVCIEKNAGERIELISSFIEGGLTPSYGLIKNVVNTVKIPVNVMIRPHAKSFVYSHYDLEVMKEDILTAKALKANGVVFGTLNEDNEICVSALEKLLAVSSGLSVTFHRAFDELSDLPRGLEILSAYPQITNILTSGGPGRVGDHVPLIKKMIAMQYPVKLLLGSGLDLENLRGIKSATAATDFHFGTGVRYNQAQTGDIDGERLRKIVKISYGSD